MAYRASLIRCMAHVIERYRQGETRLLTITCNTKGKYYSVLNPEELEEALERIEQTNQRVVVCCTPGEMIVLMECQNRDLFRMDGDDAKA